MKQLWTLVALGALAGTAQAAPKQCVDVRLSSDSLVLRGDVDVTLKVQVSNTCRHPVQVLSWQLPGDEIESRLFRIVRDGMFPVAYTGPLAKRAKPGPEDHVKLDAGGRYEYSVELTSLYDLTQNGRYTVSYAAKAHGNGFDALESQPLHLWLEGRSAKGGSLPVITPQAASISYTGRCSASQISTLQQAVTAATNYSAESASYLAGSGSGTERYVKWFGAYTSSRWAEARTHFEKSRDAFQTQALTLDCGCKKKGTYAYVYPNQPYKIYVCGAFWSAPMTGTDSKGGTLVHEMMHFTVIAGTDDWAYGQSAAAALAISDPVKALNNSDNHEYFAENTPFLR